MAWFNPEKGFGFVKADDGSEAFLHIRPLEAAGHKSVSAGAVSRFGFVRAKRVRRWRRCWKSTCPQLSRPSPHRRRGGYFSRRRRNGGRRLSEMV